MAGSVGQNGPPRRPVPASVMGQHDAPPRRPQAMMSFGLWTAGRRGIREGGAKWSPHVGLHFGPFWAENRAFPPLWHRHLPTDSAEEALFPQWQHRWDDRHRQREPQVCGSIGSACPRLFMRGGTATVLSRRAGTTRGTRGGVSGDRPSPTRSNRGITEESTGLSTRIISLWTPWPGPSFALTTHRDLRRLGRITSCCGRGTRS